MHMAATLYLFKMVISRTSFWLELLLLASVCSRTNTQKCIPQELCSLIWDPNLDCCTDKVTSTTTVSRAIPPFQLNGSSTATTKLRSEFTCGRQILDSNKIVGGTETKIGEFPWMAVIFYAKYNRNECAGSVIQKHFILTAAHCLIGQILYVMGKPYKVRLGEHDLTTDPDCSPDNTNLCSNVVEIQILNTFPHPKYLTNSRSSYDIGIIKVIDEIVYNNFVQPICFDIEKASYLSGQLFFIAGWGKTENAPQSYRKLKASISFVNTTKCRQVYSDRNVRDDHICAGGVDGIDSCYGDSGAPLMLFKNNLWYVVGVVSMGHSICGRPNHPALYTRSDMHIQWIQRKMMSA